jgi:hypothetical protein
VEERPILDYKKQRPANDRRSRVPPISALQLLIIFWLLIFVAGMIFIVHASLQE